MKDIGLSLDFVERLSADLYRAKSRVSELEDRIAELEGEAALMKANHLTDKKVLVDCIWEIHAAATSFLDCPDHNLIDDIVRILPDRVRWWRDECDALGKRVRELSGEICGLRGSFDEIASEVGSVGGTTSQVVDGVRLMKTNSVQFQQRLLDCIAEVQKSLGEVGPLSLDDQLKQMPGCVKSLRDAEQSTEASDSGPSRTIERLLSIAELQARALVGRET